MNTPDVYTVYYQLTCKNRKSLVNENDDARRQCCFYVVVYRTLTTPTIEDVTYTGSAIYPTVSYLNGELTFEQSYYTVSYPAGQDNVNAAHPLFGEKGDGVALQAGEVYHRPRETEPGDCGAFEGDGG